MTLSIGLDFIGMGAFTPSGVDYSSAVAGYSTRKVNPSYGGYAMRISNGTTTQDIGFSGTDLDTASIVSYLSGSEGYVITWYDQFGSNDLTSEGALVGPRICVSGTVDTKNSKPCIRFVSTRNSYFSKSAFSALSAKTYYAFSMVVSAESDTPANARIASLIASGAGDDYSSSTSLIGLIRQGSDLNHLRGGAGAAVGVPYTAGTLLHALAYQNTSTYEIQKNGGTAVTYAQSPTALATNPIFSIGAHTYGPGDYFFGYVGEFVIWDTQRTSDYLASVAADAVAYWGIS